MEPRLLPRLLPILMSGPLVRAVLAGDKTETRRLMDPTHAPIAVEPYNTPNVFMSHRDGTPLDKWLRFTPEASALIEHMRPEVSRQSFSGDVKRPTKAALRNTMRWQANCSVRSAHRWTRDEVAGLCPFGIPGDQLYVRETATVLQTQATPDYRMWVRYEADGTEACVPWPERIREPKPGHKLANGAYREACRLTLEVLSVRVERLREITEAGARAEGARSWMSTTRPWSTRLWSLFPDLMGKDEHGLGSARMAFANAWNTIYGGKHWNLKPDPAPWDQNPWVWVVGFRRVEAAHAC